MGRSCGSGGTSPSGKGTSSTKAPRRCLVSPRGCRAPAHIRAQGTPCRAHRQCGMGRSGAVCGCGGGWGVLGGQGTSICMLCMTCLPETKPLWSIMSRLLILCLCRVVLLCVAATATPLPNLPSVLPSMLPSSSLQRRCFLLHPRPGFPLKKRAQLLPHRTVVRIDPLYLP